MYCDHVILMIAFPMLDSRIFNSIVLAFDSLSSDTLCQLVRVVEYGCHSISEGISLNEVEASSTRNPDGALLLRIFTRYFLILVASLFKLSQNRKLKGGNLDKILSSIDSYTSLLSENAKKKQMRMEILIELVHYSLPKLLLAFSNGGKKSSTSLWSAFQVLLLLPFKIINDEEDLRKYHLRFCAFISKLCMEGIIEPQNMCSILVDIHNHNEEFSFVFLDYFVQLVQNMVELTNKKSKDVSKAVELLSILSKKIPKVFVMYISDLDFISNSSNGSIRKYFLEVISNLIEANILNKDFLNIVLQRTNDKDAFVRTRAFQKIADISSQVDWNNYAVEFNKFLVSYISNMIIKVIRILALITSLTSQRQQEYRVLMLHLV